MTAIAQWGNELPLLSFWTLPEPEPEVDVGWPAAAAEDKEAATEEADAADAADAAEAEAAEAEAAEEVEAMELATESATVVSTVTVNHP